MPATRNFPIRPIREPRTHRVRVLLAAVLAGVLVLTGCSRIGADKPDGSDPTATAATHGRPPEGEPDAAPTLDALARALQSGDLGQVAWVGDPNTAAKAAAADYATIMAGMDGLKPKVVVLPIEYKGSGVATGTLKQTYTIGAKPWEFSSKVGLNLVAGSWRVVWNPSIVHEQVTATTRMRHTRELPTRAPILGAEGKAVMESRTLYEIGLDKQNLPKDQWAASAKALAEALTMDVAAYQRKVAAHGPQAFVLANTLRRGQFPDSVRAIPGVLAIATQGTVAVDPGFATSILGTVGEASAAQAKASKGAVEAGEPIGLTGLQARYDAQLRGTPGHLVMLVQRRNAPSPPPSAAPHVDLTLYSQDPVPGKPVQTTVNTEWQRRAQTTLAGTKQVAALVAVNARTGEVFAAAESPEAKGQPFATFGRYAPGSTFKTVTALAMLRQGMSPTSMVDCPATTVVNGRTFKNYDDYPAARIGRITLQDAFANSCNTAFIQASADLPKGALASAAASLGFGVDFDAGFPVFYGQVPASNDPVVNAANGIGQGQVLASPLAMAGIGASIASGHTVVPFLVKGQQPKPTAAALTAAEASALQQMMRTTVSDGAARSLQGVVTGAKTGTAEYGNDTPPRTHAWMLVYKGDIALAVLVADGESGSKNAAPLVKAFLG